eukprot:scaffold105616_cov38-Prasinocladus_malaysianus.AAC.1
MTLRIDCIASGEDARESSGGQVCGGRTAPGGAGGLACRGHFLEGPHSRGPGHCGSLASGRERFSLV